MSYSEKVLDHYENPRNVGSFETDAPDVGTGMVGAPACGDVMKLQIKVRDDGVIEDARFKTYGCGSAIASSSLLTEWVKGKTLGEALEKLQGSNPRMAQIVDMRYFGGFSISECAEILGVSDATVNRDWRVARLWLYDFISSEPD